MLNVFVECRRWERFLGFLLCCAGAAVCFLVAFLTLPLLAIKPRKFAVAFSMGSLLFMLGFAILAGPVAHFKHITSPERLPFTAAWLGSLGLTLFFAIAVSTNFDGSTEADCQSRKRLTWQRSYAASYS